MITESFGFPWDKLDLSEEYKRMSLDEKIDYLYLTIFGENPDENDPAFQNFNIGIKMIRESLKKNEDQS